MLDLLVTARAAALAEATRLRNQLHQLLFQVDPDYKAHRPSLTSAAGLHAVERSTVASSNALQTQRAAAIRRRAQRRRVVVEQAAALEQEIGGVAAAHYQPRTAVQGVGVLTAGARAGILGPGQRCKAEARLAAYAGVAPLEASAAGQVRHRLNRGGNRRLKAILYRIAVAQARWVPEAQASLARRRADGKRWREALRALKR